MSMNWMRDNMKAVMIFIVIAFVASIFLVWGMDVTGTRGRNPGIIGIVNGEKIYYKDFYAELQNAYTQEQQKDPTKEMDEDTIERIEEQTWNSMVYKILIDHEIKKRKIVVTDTELIEFIRSAPPELREQEAFKDSLGNFDMQRYEMALTSDQIDWLSIENYYRETLPFQKLQQQVQASVRITDWEIKQDYINKNEKVKCKYIFIDPNEIEDASIKITEELLKAYYDEHPEDYEQEEQRKLGFAVFNKEATKEDEALVEKRLDDIYSELDSGTPFEDLAVKYSADPGSGANGGDLGWFTSGKMVKPFSDAAFALENIGDVSEPVESQFGWHIIKLEGKRKKGDLIEETNTIVEDDEVHCKHILLKTEPSKATLEKIEIEAQEFYKQIANIEDYEQIVELAKEKDVEWKESNYFINRGNYIPGIGSFESGIKFTFGNVIGTISELLENEQGYYILRINEIKPEGIKDYEDVKRRVEDSLKKEKKLEVARKRAATLQKLVEQNIALEEIAKQNNYKMKITDFISREDYIPGVGRKTAFTGYAFALPKNKSSPMIETTNGFFYLKVIAHQKANMKKLEIEMKTQKEQLLAQKKGFAFMAWYTSLKEDAKIEDKREELLGMN